MTTDDARRHLATLAAYAREARTLLDFWRLLRMRLSRTPLGRLVCRRRIGVDIRLRSLGTVFLRSHTTDILVLGELIEARSYEPLAAAAPGRVLTIVDLGANTGLASRWLLERFPGARVVAVEPEEGNLAVLRRNLRSVGERAQILNACIGATERRVVMVGGREVGGREDCFRMTDDGDGDTQVVTMNRVLEKLGSARIDVLKVDIEGAEEELFGDCGHWIDRVGVLSVECHHPFTAERLLEQLVRSGARLDSVATERTKYHYDMALVRIGTGT